MDFDNYLNNFYATKIACNPTEVWPEYDPFVYEDEDKTILIGVKEGVTLEGAAFIPERVKTIGPKALMGQMKMRSLILPEGLIYIKSEAFSSCNSISSLIIPNSVTTIESDAFNECTALKVITIGKSVSSIGEYVFYGVDPDVIKVDSENVTYDSRENCNAIIKTTSNELIFGCHTTSIPKNIVSIGEAAFGLSKITNLTIPSTVIKIGPYAFYGCSNLSTVSLDDALTFIGASAFSHCLKLKTISIPEAVVDVGQAICWGCTGLTSVTINNPVIPAGAFQGCTNLSKVTFGNQLTTVNDWAFYQCSKLHSITIPSNVTTIAAHVFTDCTFTKVNFINNSSATGYPWGATITE